MTELKWERDPNQPVITIYTSSINAELYKSKAGYSKPRYFLYVNNKVTKQIHHLNESVEIDQIKLLCNEHLLPLPSEEDICYITKEGE